MKNYDTDKIARLRKAFVDDGDFAAMIELSHIYTDMGEQDKANELIDIYMERGDYLWIAEAEEAMMRQKNS